MTTSSIDSSLLSPLREQIRKQGAWLMWMGAAFLAIGIAALVYPNVTSFVATVFVGWVLIFSGAASFFGSFSIRGAGPFFGALLFSLLSVGAGVLMIAQPATGELAIVLSLGALFMIQGAFELAMAFELRRGPGWGWLLLSALASIALSIAVLAGLPQSSSLLLSIIIGVNFISSGVAYLMVGGTARRIAKD
jgi:uncharacterized membrane protein HdeD (DUF308 family)